MPIFIHAPTQDLTQHDFVKPSSNQPTRTATGVSAGKESESGATYGLGWKMTAYILMTLSVLVVVALALALVLVLVLVLVLTV